MTIISNSFAPACGHLLSKYTISTLQSANIADNQDSYGCILKFTRFPCVKKSVVVNAFFSSKYRHAARHAVLSYPPPPLDRASAVRSAPQNYKQNFTFTTFLQIFFEKRQKKNVIDVTYVADVHKSHKSHPPHKLFSKAVFAPAANIIIHIEHNIVERLL